MAKLEKSLQDIRSSQPRKKFAFSKKIEKKKETAEKEPETKEPPKTEKEEKPDDHLALIKGIENKKDYKATLKQEDLDSSFKLVALENCQIDLNGKMKAVFLKNLKNCVINVGITEGACFVDGCIDCKIQIMAHQVTSQILRIMYLGSYPQFQRYYFPFVLYF